MKKFPECRGEPYTQLEFSLNNKFWKKKRWNATVSFRQTYMPAPRCMFFSLSFYYYFSFINLNFGKHLFHTFSSLQWENSKIAYDFIAWQKKKVYISRRICLLFFQNKKKWNCSISEYCCWQVMRRYLTLCETQ